MTALICDVCGGTLAMDASGEFAVCESCGAKYHKERILEKIQEIHGTVKIDGAVETVIGDAEKERLIKNAETFLQIGDIDKAIDICFQLTNDYPEDFRTWREFILAIFHKIENTHSVKLKYDINLRSYFQSYDLLELHKYALNVCKDDRMKDILLTEWKGFWITISKGIVEGDYIIDNLQTFTVSDNAFNTFPKISESMNNIIKAGYTNAKLLSDNNIRYGYLHTDSKTKGWLPYDPRLKNGISFAIGKQLIWKDINTPYDANTCGVELFEQPISLNQAYIEKIKFQVRNNQAKMISSNYCPFCGHYPLDYGMFGRKECRNCESRFN